MYDAVRYEKIPTDITEETQEDEQGDEVEAEGGEEIVYLRP